MVLTVYSPSFLHPLLPVFLQPFLYPTLNSIFHPTLHYLLYSSNSSFPPPCPPPLNINSACRACRAFQHPLRTFQG